MVSGMIVSSTVARLVEVPARGSNENATFPKGQLVKDEDCGDGTTSCTVVDVDLAAAGEHGKKRGEVVATSPCRITCRRFHELMVFGSNEFVALHSLGRPGTV
jgi:hypothetical protein